MYQEEDQLLEMIQLWERVEDILGDLRIEAEAALRHCSELTDERDDKGYQLLEAEERIRELEDEIRRLNNLEQRKYHHRHTQKRLKPESNAARAGNSTGRAVG